MTLSELLVARGVAVGHGRLVVLSSVDLSVASGDLVALVGPNGCGKTTLMETLAGLLRPVKGQIFLEGRDVSRAGAAERRRKGLALVREGSRMFSSLTVQETLQTAAETLLGRGASTLAVVEELLERFPLLAARRGISSAALSGGEARILAIARALVVRPSVLLVDEPFLGLAPRMCDTVTAMLADLRYSGMAMLVADESESSAATLDPSRLVDLTGNDEDFSAVGPAPTGERVHHQSRSRRGWP